LVILRRMDIFYSPRTAPNITSTTCGMNGQGTSRSASASGRRVKIFRDFPDWHIPEVVRVAVELFATTICKSKVLYCPRVRCQLDLGDLSGEDQAGPPSSSPSSAIISDSDGDLRLSDADLPSLRLSCETASPLCRGGLEFADLSGLALGRSLSLMGISWGIIFKR
jgi:hypothetical protein